MRRMILIASAVFALSTPAVEAQCNAPMNSYCTMIGTGTYCVQRWANATGPMGCAITASMNVTLCNVVTALTPQIAARGPSSALPQVRSCQAACGCGTLRIDNSDGLPVELLEFEVEDEPADGSGSGSGASKG